MRKRIKVEGRRGKARKGKEGMRRDEERERGEEKK